MLAQPTGIGKGASEEQDEAWRKIAVAKGMRISDTLQRDFDAPELAAEFPGAPVCVGFTLAIKDAEDVGELLDNVVKAEGVGLRVDAVEISERSGLKLTRAEGDVVTSRGQGEGAPGTAQASFEDQHPQAGTVPGAPALAATGSNHDASRLNPSTH